MSRMSELESLGEEALKEKLIWEPQNAHNIKQAIMNIRAKRTSPASNGNHNNYKLQPKPQSPTPLFERLTEIDSLRRNAIRDGFPLGASLEIVQQSDWDRIDPKINPRTGQPLMQKEAWEVDEFMDDITAYPHYFNQLSPPQQNFYIMIIDAYKRWLRKSSQDGATF